MPRSRSTAASASSSLRSKRAGDEPVLGLARVELALGPLGLILGALQREALTGEQLLVLVLELADRAGGRGHPGRGHRLEERVDDRLLQSAAAERLAAACRCGAARGRGRTRYRRTLPPVPE